MATSEFHIGQKVNVKAYTDCFGKHHEAITGMTVIEMEHIFTESIAPYYRIKAIGENGKGYFLAADRFFEDGEGAARLQQVVEETAPVFARRLEEIIGGGK